MFKFLNRAALFFGASTFVWGILLTLFIQILFFAHDPLAPVYVSIFLAVSLLPMGDDIP